ncbi:MAG: type I-E CRISPR-associated protein Cas6/Cse3/CasE [Clostridiaceae bacterium]|nr:type I-E CRISPR-associated protein Cas6/Cse3/CasE [Clostridiaceae bacterium]
MYLSRVEIDTRNRRKIKDLTRLTAFHNWVESSFPNEVSQGIRRRKLWRIDRLQGKDYLLIVSEQAPSIPELEKYGVEKSGQVKDYTSFLEGLEEDKNYRFRITLNPVIAKIEVKGQQRGRIKPLVSVEEQMQFLYDRSEKNGFRLQKDNFHITEREFVPYKQANGKLLRLNKVTYEGLLQIVDKDIFIKTLTKGFGKKKAYGFGMMTVIPEA